jgi:dienelactone hydrolase
VEPAQELFDRPVTITVSGLSAGEQVTLRSTARDVTGVAWAAAATFTADWHGTVSTTQPSTGGSYTGVDQMGLFQLQAPTGPAASQPQEYRPKYPWNVTITATTGGQTIGSDTTTRLVANSKHVGVTYALKQPPTDGVYGRLFHPANLTGRHPAVLVFDGSEPDDTTYVQASLLAAHGYPSMSLGYFGSEPGLPQTLTNVPLEYFHKALTLLAAQPGVDPNHILVWGVSRGSEAALLLGVHYPDLVHGVIAASPSSNVNRSYPDGSPAWTFAGKPIPAAPVGSGPNPPLVPDAVIPVERINGPIFTICGGGDQIWPSCAFSDAIATRLSAQRVRFPHTELKYPAAGHLVGDMLPNLPDTITTVGTTNIEGGGTTQANDIAQADGYSKLLSFLASQ